MKVINLGLYSAVACSFCIMGFLGISMTSAEGSERKVRGMILVKEGQPKASIVVRDTATPCEHFAAAELNRYIQKMSGAKLLRGKKSKASVQIHLQINPDCADYDGFHIRCTTDEVVLQGANERGVLYATYELLERLGCRFLAPGEEGENIPKLSTISLKPFETTQTPSHPTRGFMVDAVGSWNMQFVDWLAKNRYNTLRLMLQTALPPETVKAVKKRGFRIEYMGHRSFWKFLHLAREGKELSREKLFAEHPEYYPMTDGKRSCVPLYESYYGGDGFLCFSNPGVSELISRNIVTYIKKHPYLDGILFLAPDGLTGWCECPECQKIEGERHWDYRRSKEGEHLVRSDILGYFTNEVAKRVHQELPEFVIGMIGYVNCEVCPRNPDLFTSPPVAATVLANFWFCSLHSFTDGNSPHAEGLFPETIRDWGKMKNLEFGIGEYLHDFCRGCYYPYLFTMSENIKGSYALGGQAVISVPCCNPVRNYLFDRNGMMYMLLARLGWKVNLDPKEVIREYCNDYYGPAGEVMARYYLFFEEETRFSSCGAHGSSWIPRLLKGELTAEPELLDKAEAILQEATQKVVGTPYVSQVEQTYNVLRYSRLRIQIQDLVDELEKAKRVPDAEERKCLKTIWAQLDKLTEGQFAKFGGYNPAFLTKIVKLTGDSPKPDKEKRNEGATKNK